MRIRASGRPPPTRDPCLAREGFVAFVKEVQGLPSKTAPFQPASVCPLRQPWRLLNERRRLIVCNPLLPPHIPSLRLWIRMISAALLF